MLILKIPLFRFSVAELACDVVGTRKFDFVKGKILKFELSQFNLSILTEIEKNDSRYLQGGPSRLSDRGYNRNKAVSVK